MATVHIAPSSMSPLQKPTGTSPNNQRASGSPESHAEQEQPIRAYAKLEFPGFSYYIQTLEVTIGRRPQQHTQALMGHGGLTAILILTWDRSSLFHACMLAYTTLSSNVCRCRTQMCNSTWAELSTNRPHQPAAVVRRLPSRVVVLCSKYWVATVHLWTMYGLA